MTVARGAVVAAVALALTAGCAPTGTGPTPPADGDEELRHSWVRPVLRLDVDDPLGPDGGISVSPGAPGRLDVALRLRWQGPRPVLAEDWVGAEYGRFWEGGDSFRSAIGCAAGSPAGGPRTCSARYTITQPATAEISARTTDAPITARGLRADTALTTGAGAITMDDLAGTLRANTVTGDIRGGDLAPETIYVVTGGRVDLSFVGAPRDILVDGGDAPVTLELPRGPTYDIVTDPTPPDRTVVDVPSDPNARHSVLVQTRGAATIRYAP